jgi:hypothetical protein
LTQLVTHKSKFKELTLKSKLSGKCIVIVGSCKLDYLGLVLLLFKSGIMKEIGMCFVPVLTQKNVFLLTKQYSLVIKVIVFSFF